MITAKVKYILPLILLMVKTFLIAQEHYDLIQLTEQSSQTGFFDWSPDGSQILFQGKSLSLYLLDIYSAKIKEIVSSDSLIPVPKSWTPDGKRVLVSMRNNPKREANLWLISLDGEKKQLTFDGKTGYLNGHFSPDGSMIVFTTYETKKIEVISVLGGESIQLTFAPEAKDSDPKFHLTESISLFKEVFQEQRLYGI